MRTQAGAGPGAPGLGRDWIVVSKQVSPGQREIPSFKSSPPEKSKGLGHHLIESCVDLNPTVKDVLNNFPML